MENQVKIGIGAAAVALVVVGVYFGFSSTGLKGQMQIPGNSGRMNQNKVMIPPANKFHADKSDLVASDGKCKNPGELLYTSSGSGKYKEFESFYSGLKEELGNTESKSSCSYQIYLGEENDGVGSICKGDEIDFNNGSATGVVLDCTKKTADGSLRMILSKFKNDFEGGFTENGIYYNVLAGGNTIEEETFSSIYVKRVVNSPAGGMYNF